MKQVERGEALSVGQVWELSRLWYHNRLSPDYRGRTVAEVEAIFRQVGLRSPFWRMSFLDITFQAHPPWAGMGAKTNSEPSSR